MIGMCEDPVRDLPCMQIASYLERSKLMWLMLLHLHINLNVGDDKDDDDDDDLGMIYLHQ